MSNVVYLQLDDVDTELLNKVSPVMYGTVSDSDLYGGVVDANGFLDHHWLSDRWSDIDYATHFFIDTDPDGDHYEWIIPDDIDALDSAQGRERLADYVRDIQLMIEPIIEYLSRGK
jgi:hypothetical protein